MLTPPGMGGKKYRITGDRYPRMRRPRRDRRIAMTVVASACVLAVGAWGAVQLIDVFTGQSGTAQAAQEKPKCPAGQDGAKPRSTAKPLPKPRAVKVNVLNATTRSGLAKSTADALKKRGFTIGEVGNAPAAYDKKVKGTGLLLGAPAATDSSFKVLGTQVAAGVERKTDGRKGGEVDLIIGNKFKALAKEKDAEAALAALTAPPKEKPGTPGC
ncbi:LytR C-terminal domain-containing protein [Streptomyces sp. NPDC053560]|uniref:LytR C-terminal domain-containing protein n=1 Tax=Streptomyces sp. NPDC053560 TaxID=3365711 RepID=UPI0037D18C74